MTYPKCFSINPDQTNQLISSGDVREQLESQGCRQAIDDLRRAWTSGYFSQFYYCYAHEGNFVGLFGVVASNKKLRALIGEYTTGNEQIPSYAERLEALRTEHKKNHLAKMALWIISVVAGLVVLWIAAASSPSFAFEMKPFLGTLYGVTLIGIGIIGAMMRMVKKIILDQAPNTDLLTLSFHENRPHESGVEF